MLRVLANHQDAKLLKKATKSNSEAHPVHLSTKVVSFYNQISPKNPVKLCLTGNTPLQTRHSPGSTLSLISVSVACAWTVDTMGCTFQAFQSVEHQTWSQGSTLILSCTKILVPHTSWISGNIVLPCSDVYIAFSSIFTCTVHSANKSHVTTKHCQKHKQGNLNLSPNISKTFPTPPANPGY